MASSKILLVDSDARSVRVLEVSLKKAGYQVATAGTVEGALHLAKQFAPDLVVTETQLPDQKGTVLCEQLRANPDTSTVGVLFLSQAADAQSKVDAINVGADVFLAKPVLVKDILVQINSTLEKRQTDAISRRERPGNLSGTLANMGVVDLLQIMEAGFKSGIVHVSSDPSRSGGYVADGQERGTLFFRDGQVIDARLGKLRGVEAVYRMLLWDDGVFEIEFKMISRDNVVRSTTQAILLEGMRRVDEWSRFSERLPPLDSQLAVDFDALARAYPEVPADIKPVLHMFDAQRSLFEVINDAPMVDTEALELVSQLHEHGVLHRAAPTKAPDAESKNDSQLEDWLSGPVAPALPSALGRAMIPSQETASQIMKAADPLAPREDSEIQAAPPRAETEVPEPIEEPSADQPSLVLSRHTVPANRAVPLTQTSAPAPEPIPLTQPASPAKLQIQRVSSVISAPSRRASSVARAPAEERIPLPRAEAVSSAPAPVAQAPAVDPAGGEDLGQTAKIEAAVLTAAVAQHDVAEEAARQRVGRSPSYVVAPAAPPPWPVASSTPEPVAPSVSTESESEAPTPAPVAAQDTAPTRVPAAAEAGFVDHDRPTNDPTHVERPQAPVTAELPARSQPPKKELSNFNEDFFDKPGHHDDLEWEGGESKWKSNLPGILVALAIVLALGVLVLGPNKHKKPEETAEANKTTTTQPPPEKRAAAWPKSPSEGVQISDAPAKPDAKDAAKLAGTEGEPKLIAPVRTTEAGGTNAAATAKLPVAPAEPAKIDPPKVVPIEEKPAADPAKAAALVKKGVDALLRERYPVARRSFYAALKADPNNAGALAGLAQVYLDQENFKRAKGFAWRALKQDPATPRAHLVMGTVAQIEGDTKRAKYSYNRFLKYESTGKRADEIRRILQSMQ